MKSVQRNLILYRSLGRSKKRRDTRYGKRFENYLQKIFGIFFWFSLYNMKTLTTSANFWPEMGPNLVELIKLCSKEFRKIFFFIIDSRKYPIYIIIGRLTITSKFMSKKLLTFIVSSLWKLPSDGNLSSGSQNLYFLNIVFIQKV